MWKPMAWKSQIRVQKKALQMCQSPSNNPTADTNCANLLFILCKFYLLPAENCHGGQGLSYWLQNLSNLQHIYMLWAQEKPWSGTDLKFRLLADQTIMQSSLKMAKINVNSLADQIDSWKSLCLHVKQPFPDLEPWYKTNFSLVITQQWSLQMQKTSKLTYLHAEFYFSRSHSNLEDSFQTQKWENFI